MSRIKIEFSNLFQLFIFAGKTPEDHSFSEFAPSKFIKQFKDKNLDILATAEMLIDDSDGNSQYVEMFSKELNLPYYKTFVNEKSWVFEGKYYGMTIFSKFPIKNYEIFNLPNPKLEVDRPNGDHWIMHDKSAQKVTFEVDGQLLDLFNLHYFPVHHFNKRIDDPELHNIKEELLRILSGSNNSTIITGDFNNKGVVFDKAFPELVEGNKFKESLIVDTTLYGGKDQLDHILYDPSKLSLIKSSREESLSDHYALYAEFDLSI